MNETYIWRTSKEKALTMRKSFGANLILDYFPQNIKVVVMGGGTYFKPLLVFSILNQLGVGGEEGVHYNCILFKAFKVSMWPYWLLSSHYGLRTRVAFSGKVSPTSDLTLPLYHLPHCTVVFSYT